MSLETKIIDGKAFAEKLRKDIAARVAKLKTEKNITPGLAVVLVGNNPASEVYVKNKAKQTSEAGMKSFVFRLPEKPAKPNCSPRCNRSIMNPERARHPCAIAAAQAYQRKRRHQRH